MPSIRPLAFALAACALALPLRAENIMLVLDASGSMWGQIEGKPKISIAREAVGELLGRFRPEDQIGLIAYGHRRRGDCGDIEPLLPVGPLDAAAFRAKVDGLNPKGMTPLSAAVKQGAEALKSSEQKATVILLSDGEETCDLDPCAVGAELEKNGIDFTAHVIGFDIADPRHKEQLACLARATGGRYFDARNAGELREALGEAQQASTEAKLPPADATLSGPAEAQVASTIAVNWTGPADEGDYITVVSPQAEALAYDNYDQELQPGQPATLRTLAEPGRYELRYVSPRREQPVLARAPITLTPAAATVQAPTEVIASDLVSVRATGPAGDSHWIGFAPAGSDAGTYRDYIRPDEDGSTEAELAAPQEPGRYELRYVLEEAAGIVASQPVTVLPARPVILQPPTELAVDAPIELQWEGPRAARNWIGFVPRGGDASMYQTYAYANAERRVAFRAPSEAGDYDLVFVIGGELGEQIAVRYPVSVR